MGRGEAAGTGAPAAPGNDRETPENNFPAGRPPARLRCSRVCAGSGAAPPTRGSAGTARRQRGGRGTERQAVGLPAAAAAQRLPRGLAPVASRPAEPARPPPPGPRGPRRDLACGRRAPGGDAEPAAGGAEPGEGGGRARPAPRGLRPGPRAAGEGAPRPGWAGPAPPPAPASGGAAVG